MSHRNTLLSLAVGIGAVCAPGDLSAAAAARIDRQAGPDLLVQAEYDHAAMVGFLQSQGFRVLSIERTFLGRIRFVAQRDDMMREVVVSRTTGAVLRDAVYQVSDSGSGGSGSGGSGGSGSGSNGSGSGGSGSGGGSGGGSVADTGKSVRDTVRDTVDSATDSLGL